MTAAPLRRSASSAALLALACSSGAPPAARPAATPQSVVEELLAADRAYAAASARTDIITGLSAMLAADVVMPLPTGTFADGAEAVIAALRANPASAGARTEWWPVRGGVSADGQQGFTFGYMTLIQADGTRAPQKYMSYWARRPEGWRVIVFKRGRSTAGDVPPDLMPPALPARLVAPTREAAAVDGFRRSLDAAERAFSDEAQRVGLGPAFAQFGSADAVNMGGAATPVYVVGAENIGRAVGAGSSGTGSPVVWAPDFRVIVASSGDLGITLGLIRPHTPPPPGQPPGFAFFTIWRRPDTAAPWRYVAE